MSHDRRARDDDADGFPDRAGCEMSEAVEERRLYDVTAEEVVAAVDCTWCGLPLGHACAARDIPEGRTHAQRWYDYWNATHGRSECLDVFPAGWRT